MGRRRRKSRINNCDLVDRISPLPDSVLSLILSFLPTKNAVATSVLSKSWKFAWVTVDNLDIYHDGYLKRYSEGENMKFVRFVNRVLLLHDAILLKRFHLSWMYGCNSSHVTSWINTAIRRNVHELSLWLDTPPKSPSRQIEMPTSVFNCGSLRSLDLIFPIYFSTAMVGCLPRLESLRLSSVHFESEEACACEKLISSCPMLRYLRLNISFTCDDDDYFTCIISSASLRHLDMSLNYKIILKLKASSLEYLWLNGDVSRILVEKSLRFLVQANFNIKVDEPDLSILETVRALDCAKSLAFPGPVKRALTCATVRLSTKFKRLVKLVGGPLCNSLLDFIQSSDNLEVLIIHQHSHWLGMSGFHDQSNWIAPVEVPRCVSTSLKKVVVDGYYGNEDECEMIRYMLKHGSALEVMQISCDKNVNDKEFELLQTICEFPRKSPACEVQLSEWPSTKFKHLY